MKKIVILTTSLMLVSGGINATETLNKLVETKIEQSPITMEAPAPLPIGVKPIGVAFKLVVKAYKKAGKEILSKMHYKKFPTLRGLMEKKPLGSKKYITYNEALGCAFVEEMLAVIKEWPTKGGLFKMEDFGARIKVIFDVLGDDIIQSRENLESLEYLIRNDVYDIMEEFLTSAKNIDDLASKVRAKIVAESNKEIDLGFAINQKANKPNKKLQGYAINWKNLSGTDIEGEFRIESFINEDGNFVIEKYLAKKPREDIFFNSGDQIFEDLPVHKLLSRKIEDGSAMTIREFFKDGEILSKRVASWANDDMAKCVGVYNDAKSLVRFIEYDSEGKLIREIKGKDIEKKNFFELIEQKK